MKNIKFSIITVVYNNVKEIEQTIKSVINQDISKCELEYIVIDGGSEDGTCEIIKKYESQITYWQSKQDLGIYDAMNQGLDKATGDIVAFLNSGDWYEQYALKKVSQIFSDCDVDIVYGEVNRIVNEKVCSIMCASTTDGNYEDLHITNIFCHQGMFIKRNLFTKYGKFDLQYKVLADYDWNLKAYNKGAKIKVIPEIVANFRMGGLSVTADIREERRKIVYSNLNGREDLLPKIEQILNKHEDIFDLKMIYEKNPQSLHHFINKNKVYYIWGLGDNAKICFDILEKLDIRARGIIDRNARISEYNGIQVYSPRCKEILKLLSEAESCVFISSTNYETEIREELDKMGIDKEKIISLTEIGRWAMLNKESHCSAKCN